MKAYCPICGGPTLWAVNYERGERICRSCERVSGL